MTDKKNETPEVSPVEAFQEVGRIFAMLYGGDLFDDRSDEEIELDRQILGVVRDLVSEATKKFDAALLSIRKVNGDDYLSGVTTFRKPREKKEKDSPLAAFVQSAE